MDLGSPELVALDCSPEIKEEILNRKRKTSEVLEKGSPDTAIPFIKWRLALLRDLLDVKYLERKALDEATGFFFEKTGRSKTELMAAIVKEEKELRSENVIMLSQRKSFEGDLHDVDRDKTELAAAYKAELSNALEVASNMRKIVKRPKAPRLKRKEFADVVHKYLGTRDADGYKFCNAFGKWMPTGVKCAHIIPFSWNI